MAFYDALKMLVLVELSTGAYVKARMKRKGWETNSIALAVPLEKTADFDSSTFKLISINEETGEANEIGAMTAENIMATDWDVIMEADV